MSTIARGAAFENRVFSAIEAELRADRLGLSPATARAYQRKAYFSRDRDADIITDVSIEVWLPSADVWSILWVCECKDYSGSVPVDDVEEFKAKLDQIAGANKKGVMAVSGALQASALRYARANGIGVIRLLPHDQVEHLIYMMTAATMALTSRLDPVEVNSALTQPHFVGRNRGFYGAAGGYIFGEWGSLLKHSLSPSQPTS